MKNAYSADKQKSLLVWRLIWRLCASLLVFAIVSAALSGCSDNPDKLVQMGDQCLSQGDRTRALAAYREALKISPDHADAREKAARLEAKIRREQIDSFEEAFFTFFVVTSLPFSLILFFTRTAIGRDVLQRIRLASGLYNWEAVEDVRNDFVTTRDFLARKGVNSYLTPLANILREFFLMRDTYIYSQQRLAELDRILQQDLPRLNEISHEVSDSGYAAETRGNIKAYLKRIEQQKDNILEFASIFIEKKRQLIGFLIDLRTRLDLDDSFDGRHEIELLVQQMSAIRKTFVAAEKNWG